jgi:nucleoside-diphosphate kinase
MLIKPDATGRNAIGAITAEVENAGFVVRGLRMVRLSKQQAGQFYREHTGKVFFDELLTFMTSGPIVALSLEKDNAIVDLRTLVGATDSRKADADTIRGTFGTDNSMNAVHASDSSASANRETAFFFNQFESFTREQ